MHKVKKILIVFVMLALIACKSESAMNIEQPHYYIKLNMQTCTRVITVNGFEVESDFDGLASTAEIPINHLIKNGENYFELILADDESIKGEWTPNSRCEVEVRVSGRHKNEEVDYKVADIKFIADYSKELKDRYITSMPAGEYAFEVDGPKRVNGAKDSVIGEIKSLPAYEAGMDGVVQRTFTANVPFPKWAFFDGDILFDGYFDTYDDDVYAAAENVIWPKVQKLWDLFESKELDKILSLFELRSKEYDQAFYREPGNTLAQLKNSIENVYASNYPIDRYENENMQMLLSYANNLVTMVNAANYNGTVMFYDHKSNSHTFYTVYWMKKDGEWIIAR